MYDPYTEPESRRPRRPHRARRNGVGRNRVGRNGLGRNGLGRNGRARRNGLGRNVGWVVALVATVPVIIVGLRFAHPEPSQLATSADAQGLPSQVSGQQITSQQISGQQVSGQQISGQQISGWGHGGYPMMPGPAGVRPVSGSAGLGPDNAADAMSANWAGYAAAQSQGSFTSVAASWTQPAVTCTEAESFSAFWVGLDGDGTATVEQTGTEADCVDGTPSYQGWYELFPNAPVFFSNPVQPADELSASVVSDGNGIFTLKLTDATQGWTQSSQQSDQDAALGSAEIIAEAPSDGQQVLPLADFGTVNFTNATINNQALGSIGNLTAITMADSGTTLATPSALTGTNAFGVTENTSASAPGQGAGGSGSGSSGGQGSGGGGGGGGGQGSGSGQGWPGGNGGGNGNGSGAGGQGWSNGDGNGGGGWNGWGGTGDGS
jgi:Peptidase A4 family